MVSTLSVFEYKYLRNFNPLANFASIKNAHCSEKKLQTNTDNVGTDH